jgi:hypothetical protein
VLFLAHVSAGSIDRELATRMLTPSVADTPALTRSILEVQEVGVR